MSNACFSQTAQKWVERLLYKVLALSNLGKSQKLGDIYAKFSNEKVFYFS
ncbi:MAG TPA: hypothetical protein V6D33_16500 [Cyanophyceae cyanobacterium]